MQKPLALALAFSPLTVVPTTALAGAPECTVRVNVQNRASGWAAPLDRIVTVRVLDVSLREALDRVAGLARVELSYSNDLLPPEKRVCLTLDRVPVGAVLETLLAGTTLRPVVIGTTQVVLAPSRSEGRYDAHNEPMQALTSVNRRASVLDRVVVTGTPDGASQRGSPFALDIVDGASLSRTGAGTLADALELAVPGIWSWSGGAGTLSARFGSVRGSSSFGVTTPKLYLDGVEVANPLLVTGLDPSRVERIEVIRGPQGAALYGAEAISGVINVLTRHDGTPSGAPSVQLYTSAGASSTDFASRAAFVQDHGVSLRGGSGRRTYGLGLNINSLGAYVPGASERRLLADADLRLVRATSVITSTARLSLQRANASSDLLMGGGALPPASSDSPRFAGDTVVGQELAQYTVGVTATMMPSLRWTNTLIAGIDGYRLQGLSGAGVPVPLAYVEDPSAGQGVADRGSLRTRAVGRFDLGERGTIALTFGAEHALTRDIEAPLRQLVAPRDGKVAGMAPATVVMPYSTGRLARDQRTSTQAAHPFITTWTNNSGVLVQANVGWRDALFLVVGGRAERTTGATPNAQVSYLPMIGASAVRDFSGTVVKFRGAYGTGIRPAHSLARSATWMGRTSLGNARDLDAERQSGVEGGFDVLMSRGFALHVTGFDQRASGLIQPVASTTTTAGSSYSGYRPTRVVNYVLQNVGAIDNRGWELQASATLSQLRVAAAYTHTDSRVSGVASGYGGDLRAGDRMLDVPLHTLSATASWTASRWTASSTLSHAADWISYDRLAIGREMEATDKPREISGAGLREYWRQYDDITRLRASLSVRLARALSLEFAGDNLLDVQLGAPDNTTVTAGRTLTFGLRTQF
ncbi:MAG TPA: TonB-dependent receptor [Gemmatimonas sp.]|nr:TonB-dependent receptor [Gemmatimonas sp.]